MKELENLINLKKEKEEIELKMEHNSCTLKTEINKLQEQLKEIQKPFKDTISTIDTAIGDMKDGIIDDWKPEWEKQFIDEDTGITLTRKTREKPFIMDEKALLTQAVTFDKLPIKKISWNNKDLKALINAGVVKSEVAVIQENYELAITYPKEG